VNWSHENNECPNFNKCGGSVWESNPPFRPLRTESPALKAGEITGPLSPPLFVGHSDYEV